MEDTLAEIEVVVDFQQTQRVNFKLIANKLTLEERKAQTCALVGVVKVGFEEFIIKNNRSRISISFLCLLFLNTITR